MSEPTFGMSITRLDNEPRPAVKADMAVIGLVGTAPNANPADFPVNEPVHFFSNDTVMLAKLGLTGSLAGQIELVNAQLGEFQVSARIVVVRVAEGGDEDETMANILGNANLRTGIHALRNAGPLLGLPGLTCQQKTGVAAINVISGGAHYEAGDTIAGAGGTGFSATVAT